MPIHRPRYKDFIRVFGRELLILWAFKLEPMRQSGVYMSWILLLRVLCYTSWRCWTAATLSFLSLLSHSWRNYLFTKKIRRKWQLATWSQASSSLFQYHMMCCRWLCWDCCTIFRLMQKWETTWSRLGSFQRWLLFAHLSWEDWGELECFVSYQVFDVAGMKPGMEGVLLYLDWWIENQRVIYAADFK